MAIEGKVSGLRENSRKPEKYVQFSNRKIQKKISRKYKL